MRRFERFATANQWKKEDWATCLGALLTGRALDIYTRLSEAQALDYETLKKVLLSRYELTEEGYRSKFRTVTPAEDGTSAQFIVRLGNYLQRWIELADCGTAWEDVRKVFIIEQFFIMCSRNLAAYVKEQGTKSLDDITSIADHYLQAHGLSFKAASNQLNPSQVGVCYHCKQAGHKAIDCPKLKTAAQSNTRKCFICDRSGHFGQRLPDEE